MIFLGVLCLAACVLAQPAVYVSRTTYDHPYLYYYPVDAPMVEIAPEKEGPIELIISGIPEAPHISPYPLIKSVVIEPAEADEEPKTAEEPKDLEENIEANKEEEPKEEELKEEESHEEEAKEEAKEEEPKVPEAPEEPHRPVLVKLKPPQFLSNLIHSLPISLPQINFPILGSLFGKPKLEPIPYPAPGPAPIDMVRYRVAYVPIMKEPLEILKK